MSDAPFKFRGLLRLGVGYPKSEDVRAGIPALDRTQYTRLPLAMANASIHGGGRDARVWATSDSPC